MDINWEEGMDIMGKSRDGGGCVVANRPLIIHTTNHVSMGKRKKMQSNGLSERQAQVLEVIRRHLKVRSVPPSRTEIAEEIGLKNGSPVDGHLDALMRKGWLIRFPSVERGIKLLREGAPVYENSADLLADPLPRRKLPKTNREPTRIDKFDSLAALFESPPDLFLRIESETACVGRYRRGDIVAVCRDLEPRSEDIVAGTVENEIVLMHASAVTEREFQLIGVVVGGIISGKGSL